MVEAVYVHTYMELLCAAMYVGDCYDYTEC